MRKLGGIRILAMKILLQFIIQHPCIRECGTLCRLGYYTPGDATLTGVTGHSQVYVTSHRCIWSVLYKHRCWASLKANPWAV